jgi:uncharacterized membrane protein YdjX (TVP38/TMEM64 family)
MDDGRLWRGAAILVGLAIAGGALYLSPWQQQLDPAALVGRVRGYQDAWWAVPCYFLLYAVLNVLFIPTQALSIAAVLLWGWRRGGTIELVAATAGSIAPFLIARSALGATVEARLAPHRKAAELLAREGFTLLLILRVVPIFPYTILNYVAGLSSLRVGQYVAATLLGMIPSTFVFAYFVDALVRGAVEPRRVLHRGIAAALLLAGLVVLARLAAPGLRRRLQSTDRTSAPTDAGGRG